MRGLTQSHWMATLADGSKVAIGVRTFGVDTGAPVYVTLLRDGEQSEFAGSLRVQRTLREVGDRLAEPIVAVEVRSLGGDVVGKARTIRGAIEDYASKVAQVHYRA